MAQSNLLLALFHQPMLRHSTFEVGHYFGQRHVLVRSSQLGPAEVTQLQHTIENLIQQGTRRVWLDCQQLELVTYYGQQVILQILQRAADANLTLFWYGFSPAVKRELAASGLYLLLRHVPLSSYQNL